MTRDFASPRLFEMSTTWSASRNVNARFFAVSGSVPSGTARSNVTTVPPPLCCDRASSRCGCDARNG
ncbi:Uncharacterised protein [Mycobacteroides abscessus]|nr:Uncharacterised protein [Mycobacteroides abscessus]